MDTRHPIARFAQRLTDALDRVAGSSPVFMAKSEKALVLLELQAAESRIAALKMRVMAVADEVTDDGAYRTVADYVASRTHSDRGPLAAAERLGAALESRWHVLAAAASDGSVSFDKVRVIAAALSALAEDSAVSAEVLEKAEVHLVGLAPDYTAKQLRMLAKRVLDVVSPELGEASEARALEAEERRAREAMTFSFHPRPDGLEGITEIRGRIHSADAARLKTYLEAFTAPRHIATNGLETGVIRKPHSRMLAEAFCSLLEALDPKRLPLHGGSATTVMVTMSLEALRKNLAAADVLGPADGDLRISASEARRLACTADLIPVVLGAKSEVLDLGRAQRLFTPAQRKAMALRDKRCKAEGCDVPANWCQAHHYRDPWARGGRTDLGDGKLLCGWHHQRAHDDRYQHNELPNGDVRFTRRR